MPQFTTVSGAEVDLDCVTPDDVDLDVVFHALSNTCRFNGHTPVFYSVLAHSILVASMAEDAVGYEDYRGKYVAALQGLLHDGGEAFYGDHSSPLKTMIPDLRQLDREARTSVFTVAGIPLDLLPQVEKADQLALLLERMIFFGHATFIDADRLLGELFPYDTAESRRNRVTTYRDFIVAGFTPEYCREMVSEDLRLLGDKASTEIYGSTAAIEALRLAR